MSLDLLDYVVMASTSKGLGFGRETHSLGGAYDYVTPADTNGNILVWRLKSSSGGPGWDIKLVTPTQISDALTEATPLSPGNFKIHNGGKGYKLADRFLTDGSSNLCSSVFSAADTAFEIYTNGLPTKSSNLGGGSNTVSGPFPIDHGGNIGVQPTMVHQWVWGPKDREENWWALNYGWCRWAAFSLVNGLWQQTQQSVHNTISKTKNPVPNFPTGKLSVVNSALVFAPNVPLKN